MTDDPTSPLTSVSPDALSALFLTDPRTLDEADVKSLIAELRRRRSAFASEEAAKAVKPKATRAKLAPQTAAQAAAVPPTADLSISDLFDE